MRYENTKTTWLHYDIEYMDLAHVFNAANMICKKAPIVYLLDQREMQLEAKKKGFELVKKEDNEEAFQKWFNKRFKCYKTFEKRLGPDLVALLGTV